MRLIYALATAAAVVSFAAPAAALSKECTAFRSGTGWAVKYVAYTGADGKLVDTVATYTYQVILPEQDSKNAVYQVNADMQRLALPSKGVVILEYGKRPADEALGKVVIAAPAYANLGKVTMAAFVGDPTPVFNHRLLLKAGPSRVLAWSTEAGKARTPAVMEADQFEIATAGLGSSDVEALGPGGLAEARKAAGIITQLAKGGRVEIQVMEDGKPVTVGSFDITEAVAREATDGAVAAKAEADLKVSRGQCVAG